MELAYDQDWAALAELSDLERAPRVRERYIELSTVNDEDRQKQLQRMVAAEYELPDEQLRAMTISRTQAWLAMDQGSAKRVAESYIQAVHRLKAGPQMRRIETVQYVSRHFTPEEQEHLDQLIPNIFALDKTETSKKSNASGEESAVAEKPAKPWWTFWRAG